MRTIADTDVRINAGMCTLTAPEVFEQADDGLVTALPRTPPEELREAVAEAVDHRASAARRSPSASSST